MGGPQFLCRISQMAMLHVFVTLSFSCSVSNSRNVNIKCHYDSYDHVVLLTLHIVCPFFLNGLIDRLILWT